MATRTQQRRATLLALSEAAVDLFEAEGPSVTVDAIADRAGVSRRTAFRHVEAKEELAFIHPILWLDEFDAALADADPQLTLDERLWLGAEALAATVDADPEPPRRAFLVAAVHPELHRGFQSVVARWVDRIAVEVTAGASPVDPFRARIVASAVMGMIDAVTREWVVSPPTVTFHQICAKGRAVVAPLLTDLE